MSDLPRVFVCETGDGGLVLWVTASDGAQHAIGLSEVLALVLVADVAAWLKRRVQAQLQMFPPPP